MAAVLDAVRLGRAARSEANVKVRQPLPAVLVYARDEATFAALDRLQDQLLDELNVKALRRLTDPGDVVSYAIKPKLPVLGPKYGRQLGAIRASLAALEPAAVARSVAAGETVDLALPEGSKISLLPDEVIVDLTRREGFAAAQSDTMTVVLDTALTAELIREGMARDFVRGVQDARKNAGLAIEDRIVIAYEADPEVGHALRDHESLIRSETLADVLEATIRSGASDELQTDEEAAMHVEEIEVGRHRVEVSVRKVG